jgi:hypothetical protein
MVRTTSLTVGPIYRSGTIKRKFIYDAVLGSDLSSADCKHASDLGNDWLNGSCAANSAATYLPANVPEYFIVTSGQVLNFISTSTSSGYLVLTEMT